MNVFIGRDNKLTLTLFQNGEAVTAGAITRAVFKIDDYVADTEQAGDPIELVEEATKIVLKPGLITGLVPGTFSGKLTVYDTEATNGVAWGGTIKLNVFSW